MSDEGKIFISYTRKDSEFALKLAKDLKDSGVSIWVDQLDIPPGSRWDEEVQKALSSCESLLVILSPVSVNSVSVRDEVNHAIEKRKTVYPVMAKYCTEDEIPFRWKRFQYVDFTGDYHMALSRLLHAIGSNFIPTPNPSFYELMLRWGRSHLMILITIFTLLIVGYGYYYFSQFNSVKRGTSTTTRSVDDPNSLPTDTEVQEKPPITEKPAVTENTVLPPSVTAAGDIIYFFVKSSDGYIFYNSAKLGNSFSGWQKMPDNIRSTSSPSACFVGNYLYIVAMDENGDTYLSQGTSSPFVDWAQLNFKTDIFPAAASVANKVYFFAGKNDGSIYYNWAVSNQGGAGWQRLPGDARANSPPAAGSVNEQIFVAARNTDGNLTYNQATAGASFNPEWLTMNVKIEGAPAVVGAGDKIYFFAKGVDRLIYYTSAVLGSSFSEWTPVNSKVPVYNFSSPSAGAIGNYLFISVVGKDGRLYYSQGSAGGTLTEWLPMDLGF